MYESTFNTKWLTERLVKKFPDSMEEVAVVLPSKRSVVFLKSYLSKLIDKPIFLPQFFSIEEFIEKLYFDHYEM